jgi:hypothetical protein
MRAARTAGVCWAADRGSCTGLPAWTRLRSAATTQQDQSGPNPMVLGAADGSAHTWEGTCPSGGPDIQPVLIPAYPFRRSKSRMHSTRRSMPCSGNAL